MLILPQLAFPQLPVIPFATTLYTGNGGTQSIVTGKNNAAGSLVWIKRRDGSASHRLFNTVRGATKYVESDTTQQEITTAATLSSFNSNGFTLGSDSNVNANATDFVAWTFLEQAGFFDIVQYTGNSNTGSQQVSHNLGVIPGCIFVKSLNNNDRWFVGHRMLNNGTNPWSYALQLDNTTQEAANAAFGSPNPPSSITFNAGPGINDLGENHIAYLFAHNPSAGIASDSFTTDGSGNATVNLGWRPQWVMVKVASGSSSWEILDKKRGWQSGNDNYLRANTADAEINAIRGEPTGIGFTYSSGLVSSQHIFIAIRDGV